MYQKNIPESQIGKTARQLFFAFTHKIYSAPKTNHFQNMYQKNIPESKIGKTAGQFFGFQPQNIFRAKN